MEQMELTLKEIQQESLKILIELKRICEEHNWKFSLAYGTLIGAIRHHGFIPWDDDIDVLMPRKDYNELIEYYKSEPEKFGFLKVFHYSTTDYYPFGIARLSDTRYELDYFGYEKLKIGLFVDLYPVDEVDEDDQLFIKQQKFRLHSIERVAYHDNSKIKNIIKSVLTPFIFLANGTTSLKGIIAKNDKKAQKYNGTNQKYCNVMAWDFGNKHFPKGFLDNIEYVDFENVKMPITADYHNILTEYYGDYMQFPPEEERIAHHFYKAYRKTDF